MLERMAVWAALRMMKLAPNIPEPDDLSRWEVFRHPEYTDGDQKKREDIERESARYRFEYDAQNPFFSKYFPQLCTDQFAAKTVLDVGSFTGGRLVQWIRRYGFESGRGIDVDPVFARAGNSFAQSAGVPAEFDVGVAEALPYANDTFDVVVSYDVFEHVSNVGQAFAECCRVLRPGGILLCVFPQFFQPLEAHLGNATRVPALHWIFPPSILARAFFEVLEERGEDATWYARQDPTLEDWERLPTLNGITLRRFRKIVANQADILPTYWGRAPILSDGRRASLLRYRMLRLAFWFPARLPLLEELFLGRVVFHGTKIVPRV